jgi:PKD domain protein
MKKYNILYRQLAILGFTILLSSCLKETTVPIESVFTIETSEDKTSPVTIQLKNESYGADEYEWTYEGGIPSSSNQKSLGKVVFTQAGATTLEVIHNAQKYIPSKYYNTLKGIQLEDVIAHADDAGDFRFDIQWSALDPKTKKSISVFVDTKNYSSASNMFKDLGQFKAYLGAIDNFDNLYIIQQGGRGITREQIINRLKNVLNKGKNKDEVFEIVWNNETLRKNVFEGLSRKKALECFSQNINSSNYEMFNSILITK